MKVLEQFDPFFFSDREIRKLEGSFHTAERATRRAFARLATLNPKIPDTAAEKVFQKFINFALEQGVIYRPDHLEIFLRGFGKYFFNENDAEPTPFEHCLQVYAEPPFTTEKFSLIGALSERQKNKAVDLIEIALPERDASIVFLRNGINPDTLTHIEPLTFAKIGEHFDLCPSRTGDLYKYAIQTIWSRLASRLEPYIFSNKEIAWITERLMKTSKELSKDENVRKYIRINDSITSFKKQLAHKEDASNTPVLILDLKLSTRARNCLERGGYKYVEEIVDFTREDFLNIRNLGVTACNEIIERLKELGLRDE